MNPRRFQFACAIALAAALFNTGCNSLPDSSLEPASGRLATDPVAHSNSPPSPPPSVVTEPDNELLETIEAPIAPPIPPVTPDDAPFPQPAPTTPSDPMPAPVDEPSPAPVSPPSDQAPTDPGPVPPIEDPAPPAEPVRPEQPIEPHARGRVLVRYHDGTDGTAMAMCNNMAGVTRHICEIPLVSDLHLVEVAVGDEIAVANALAADAHVAYAEPDWTITLSATPNDPQFGQLWGLRNTGQIIGGVPGVAGADIRAVPAWDQTTGDPNLRIAVIDTGIDYNHPDLAANMWTNPGEIPGNQIDDDRNGVVDDVHGYDFLNNDGDPMDDHNHGTHVAGTIGAVGNNGVGVTGVNWRCKLVALKFLSAGGSGSLSGAVRCIDYCVRNNIRLSNNSWGGGGFSRSLYDAISRARDAGHLFVAAVGNDGFDNDTRPAYPASYDLDNIISVAALTHQDQCASFSNFGRTTVDLGAPGYAVRSCIRNGGYAPFSGTSMASPHVTGVAALVLAQSPQLSAADVRNRILSTTRPTASLRGITVTGGCVDAAAALAAQPTPPSPPSPPANLVASEITDTTLRLTFQDRSQNEQGFRVDVALGGAEFRELIRLPANQTSHRVAGLAFDTPNRFRVFAFNSAGDSAASNIADARTACVHLAAPTQLALSPSDTSIAVSWRNNAPAAETIRIAMQDGHEDPDNPQHWDNVGVVPASQNSYVISGLTRNRVYRVKIRAAVACGFSGYSPYQTVITTCTISDPASINVRSLTTSVAEVSWAAVPGAVRYRLAILNEGEDPENPQHWDSRAGWENLTGTVFNVDRLVPGRSYRFRVRACNDDCCSDGRRSEWFRMPLPRDPSWLNVRALSYTVAEVNWEAVPGATRYGLAILTEGEDPNNPQHWDSRNGWENLTGTEFNVDGLSPGVAYMFRVRTCDGDVCSDGRRSAWLRMPAPRNPAWANVRSLTHSVAEISWEAVAGATRYRLAVLTEGEDPDNPQHWDSRHGWDNLTGTVFNVDGLSPGVAYVFRVRTCDGEICSDGRRSAWLRMPAPRNPAWVHVRDLDYTVAEVSWEPVPGATSYRLAVLTEGEDPNNPQHWDSRNGWEGLTGTVFNVDALTPGVAYMFRVRTCAGNLCSDGQSTGWSRMPAPRDPAWANVRSLTHSVAEVGWEAVPGATRYRLAILTEGEDPNYSQHWDSRNGWETLTGTVFNVDGLTPGVAYMFRVRTCDGNVCSNGRLSSWFRMPAPRDPAWANVRELTPSVAEVSWEAVPGVTGYRLAILTEGEDANNPQHWDSRNGWDTLTGTVFNVDGLAPGVAYMFRLRACDGNSCSDGRRSAWFRMSNPQPPSNPGWVHVRSLTESVAEVSWEPVAGVTQYRMAILNEGEDPDNPQHWDSRTGWDQFTGTVFNVDRLTPGVAYMFRVKACNEHGCSNGQRSGWFRMPTPQPPPDPAWVSVRALTNSVAEVSWEPIAGATRYQLAILNEGEDPNNPQHWDSRTGWDQFTGTVFNVDRLVPNRAYLFRVKACNDVGCSLGRRSGWFRMPQ